MFVINLKESLEGRANLLTYRIKLQERTKEIKSRKAYTR